MVVLFVTSPGLRKVYQYAGTDEQGTRGVLSTLSLDVGRGMRSGETEPECQSRLVDPRVQGRTGCVEGKPSPTSELAISWAIPWATPGSPGRKPSFPKPPRWAYRAGGLCCTVAPHGCIIGYSCERRIHPTDIKLNLRPVGAVCLPSQPNHARRRQGSASDRSQVPPLRRATPGQPGRPLHPPHGLRRGASAARRGPCSFP